MQVPIPERFQAYFGFTFASGEARVSFGDAVFARGTVGRIGNYESPLGNVFQLTAVAEAERAKELDAFVEELGPVAFEAAAADEDAADAPAADGRVLAELLLWRMRHAEADSECVALEVTLVKAREELKGNAVAVVGVIDPKLAHNRCHGYTNGGRYVSVTRTTGNVSVHGVVGEPRYANVHNAEANGACYVKGRDPDGSRYNISEGWIFRGGW